MALNAADRFIAKIQFGHKTRMEFYSQIVALTRAGLSKPDAIAMSWQVASHEGKKPKEGIALILQDVINSMQNGKTIGTALAPWVPNDDIMTLEAIENSDDFAGNLADYIEMSGKKNKIRSTILSGSVTPISLVSAIYGIMIYFGKSIVPQIGEALPPEQWTGAAAGLAFTAEFAEKYAHIFTVAVIAMLVGVFLSLPRWPGFGRRFFDRLPIYSTYRVYTGINFLMSVSSLLKGGMGALDAVNRLRPYANPYVRHRLDLVRKRMMNGENFGAALHRSNTGWPDKKMNLSIKVFAETQDLSKQMTNLAKSWIDTAQQNVNRSMAALNLIAKVIVGIGVMTIVFGLFAIQSQIAAAAQSF